MRNFLTWLTAFSFFLTSCSTKFNVGADYKEVSVIYGLLSSVDTAHYIKITKGYFDETANNLQLAQVPDSIYFNSLQVDMQVLNNGNVVETINLNRVDLNLEGYVKEPGTFAMVPNYAYKFKKLLDPSRTYRLKVKNLATGKEIQGETPIISNQPASFRLMEPSDETEFLEFSKPDVPYPIGWRGPSTAAFYDIVVRFKYQEVDLNANDTVYIEKDIAVVQGVPGGTGEFDVTVSSVDFFKQLNSALGDAPLNIKRYVDTPGLYILAGGQELKTYIEVNQAQGGITFDQIKPNYTNLTGENVYGIFSTRGRIGFTSIKFSENTIDSIKNGASTKNLRIVGVSFK